MLYWKWSIDNGTREREKGYRSWLLLFPILPYNTFFCKNKFFFLFCFPLPFSPPGVSTVPLYHCTVPGVHCTAPAVILDRSPILYCRSEFPFFVNPRFAWLLLFNYQYTSSLCFSTYFTVSRRAGIFFLGFLVRIYVFWQKQSEFALFKRANRSFCCVCSFFKRALHFQSQKVSKMKFLRSIRSLLRERFTIFKRKVDWN